MVRILNSKPKGAPGFFHLALGLLLGAVWFLSGCSTLFRSRQNVPVACNVDDCFVEAKGQSVSLRGGAGFLFLDRKKEEVLVYTLL